MVALNIAGLILVPVVMILGISIKLYTRKKLREIDGIGLIHSRDESNADKVWL